MEKIIAVVIIIAVVLIVVILLKEKGDERKSCLNCAARIYDSSAMKKKCWHNIPSHVYNDGANCPYWIHNKIRS